MFDQGHAGFFGNFYIFLYNKKKEEMYTGCEKAYMNSISSTKLTICSITLFPAQGKKAKVEAG